MRSMALGLVVALGAAACSTSGEPQPSAEAGRAISGELAGEQLEAVPSRSTFWFAYVAARPGVIVERPAS